MKEKPILGKGNLVWDHLMFDKEKGVAENKE